MSEKKDESVRVKLEKEDKEKLKRIAQRDNRTMSSWLTDKIRKEKE